MKLYCDDFSLHVEDWFSYCAFKFALNYSLRLLSFWFKSNISDLMSLLGPSWSLIRRALFWNLLVSGPTISILAPEAMSCGYDEVSAAVQARDPVIVDVRTEDEFASGRIPGATNIPLSEVSYFNYWFDCMKVYDIEIFGHRLNTHLAYRRINFELSTEFPNPPRPLPSSRAARSEVAPRRWGTSWMRWVTRWWRPTLAPWPSGSRWAARSRSRTVDRRLWSTLFIFMMMIFYERSS